MKRLTPHFTVFVFSQKVQAKAKTKAAIEKNPLVTFFYPQSATPWNSSLRQVRLISATPTHLIGLEVLKVNGRTKYHYKKFCQPKVTSFKIQEFNPQSMS